MTPPRSYVRPRDRFVGWRDGNGNAIVSIQNPDHPNRRLPMRLDLRNHSPTGFEWGYEGSGPAQLALALIAFATGDDDLASRVYQAFKRQFIGQLARNDHWHMDAAEVAKMARLL